MSTEEVFDVYRRLSRTAREFEVTETHLKLLRTACVDWNEMEFGAPSIDPKRPYGNSDVPRDIAELVHPEMSDWDDDRRDEWLDGHYEELAALHAETGLVLEICLRRGEFKAGRYRKTSWNRWDLIGEETTR